MKIALKIIGAIFVIIIVAGLVQDYQVYTEGGGSIIGDIIGPRYSKELKRLDGTWGNRMYTVTVDIKKGTFKGKLFKKPFSKKFDVFKNKDGKLGLEIFDDEDDFFGKQDEPYRLAITFKDADTAIFLKEGGLPLQLKRKKK